MTDKNFDNLRTEKGDIFSQHKNINNKKSMRQGQRETNFMSIKWEIRCTKSASFRITYKS